MARRPLSQVVSFESHLRGRVEAAEVSATHAKNALGDVLDTAARVGAVVITRHDTPDSVLLPFAEFKSLIATRGQKLDELTAEFDAMLMRMQRPGQRAAMESAFGATPKQLGEAAVKGARKPAAKRRG